MTHAPSEIAAQGKGGRLKPQGEAERLPPLRPGFCDYCQASTKRGARFCSPKCRTRWWSMARVRGAQLYQYLLIWRRFRGRRGTPGAGMLGKISALIDLWQREDRTDRGQS